MNKMRSITALKFSICAVIRSGGVRTKPLTRKVLTDRPIEKAGPPECLVFMADQFD
jgi:hypothetical protein